MQIAVMNLTSILIDQLRSRLRQDASIAVRAGNAAKEAAQNSVTAMEKRQDSRAMIEQGNMAFAQSKRARLALEYLQALETFDERDDDYLPPIRRKQDDRDYSRDFEDSAMLEQDDYLPPIHHKRHPTIERHGRMVRDPDEEDSSFDETPKPFDDADDDFDDDASAMEVFFLLRTFHQFFAFSRRFHAFFFSHQISASIFGYHFFRYFSDFGRILAPILDPPHPSGVARVK